MKRLLAAIICISVVGSVMAQSSFTIVRPADGSKVREKVRILIPKNSLEEGSYVGVFLNGTFVEAVVPPVQGNYRVYTLDTKGRGIADGEVKLELVKYEGGDSPRIVDRSSVAVTVGNKMNIPIPVGGIRLRYGFKAGQQLIYSVHTTKMLSTLSGLGNQNGSRPASFPESELNERILYAIDNTYSNGDALLRSQNLPDKGKDYSIMAIYGEPEPRQVFDYQMQPTYMRVDKTARPIFGSVPDYFGFSSGGVAQNAELVIGSHPLPVLPEKPVAPGSSWQATYLLPILTIVGDPFLTDKVAEAFPARGEFVDAEWELGHPCAKIRNSIAAGTRSFAGQQLEKAGKPFADDKVALDETIYFSLDTHKILKLIRSITIDHKVQIDQPGAGGQPGGPSGPGGPGGGRKPGFAGAGTGGGGGASGIGDLRLGARQNKGGGFGQPGGAQQGPNTPGPGGPRGPGGFGQGNQRSGGGGTKTQYIRQQFEQIFTLEQ